MTVKTENVKVNQWKNGKGNVVANQFIIHSPEYTAFQSYNSIIVKTTWIDGERKVFLDVNDWNYSKTTSKYRNQFLGETTKETQAKIDNGTYELIDLN